MPSSLPVSLLGRTDPAMTHFIGRTSRFLPEPKLRAGESLLPPPGERISPYLPEPALDILPIHLHPSLRTTPSALPEPTQGTTEPKLDRRIDTSTTPLKDIPSNVR